MPLPFIPVAIGIVGLLGYGTKKALDASDNFSRAKAIGKVAGERHKQAIKSLDKNRERTNKQFTSLGELKADIFTDQIKHLIEVIKKSKKARSTLKNFEEEISELNLPEMEKMVVASLEITTGVASGAVGGAMAGLGAYGMAGAIGAASTGTAISSLSGVAATNATLAWLGGGTLASGGLGIAGGTMILGGIALAPAVTIATLLMASKSEKALTDARKYERDVDVAIAEIKKAEVALKGLSANAREVKKTLRKLVNVFEESKVSDVNDEPAFHRMLSIGTALKAVLSQPILDDDGAPVENMTQIMKTKIGGIIELN